MRFIPLTIGLLACLISLNINAQDLTVPDSIVQELTTWKVNVNKKTAIEFKVRPAQNTNKSNPIALAIPGGNQSEKISNYCYAAWFRSDYLKDYTLVIPMSYNGKNLKDLTKKEYRILIKAAMLTQSAAKKDWIGLGTSNGGIALFNAINVAPKLFSKAIVVPGRLPKDFELKKNWGHIDVLLAVGENDDKGWIDASIRTAKILEEKVHSVKQHIINGQGHILPLSFDIDSVYQLMFKTK